jgi:hypothetical protein
MLTKAAVRALAAHRTDADIDETITAIGRQLFEQYEPGAPEGRRRPGADRVHRRVRSLEARRHV